jgi:hypothetical protein
MGFIDNFLEQYENIIDITTDLVYLTIVVFLYVYLIACKIRFKIEKNYHLILISLLVALVLRASLSISNFIVKERLTTE